MEKITTGVFETILEKHRENFNLEFKEKRLFNRRLDGHSFLEVLKDYVAPIVNAVHLKTPQKSEEVSLALYSLSLELFSRRYLGPDSLSPPVNNLWKETLPSISVLIARSPGRLAGHLTNAVFTLGLTGPDYPVKWLQMVSDVAPGCIDEQELIEAGKVLAWRCGMTQWRESALLTWDNLSKPLKLATLGLLLDDRDYDLEELRTSLDNRWLKPGQTLTGETEICIVGRAGKFSGFGGEMTCPPEVMNIDGKIYTFDDENCWSLHGDCFGTILLPHGKDLPQSEQPESKGTETPPSLDTEVPPSSGTEAPPSSGTEALPAADATNCSFAISKTGNISWRGKTTSIPLLSGFQSFAVCNDFAAVTHPLSHSIFILAITDRSAAIVKG
jgi:hypothetical protein